MEANKIKVRMDAEGYDDWFKVEIKPEEGEMTVWHGGNGRGYSIEELAPYTD